MQADRRCVIGLGANLGDRVGTFEAAVHRLGRLGPILKVSHLYLTEPVGGPAQPDYFNAAVLMQTSLDPRPLLDGLLRIEDELGRERVERWGPRIIDLDLLWIERESIHEAGLDVPHPRLPERAFAIFPLTDVVPDARDPDSNLLYADLRNGLRSQGIGIRGIASPGADDGLTGEPLGGLWQIADLRL